MKALLSRASRAGAGLSPAARLGLALDAIPGAAPADAYGVRSHPCAAEPPP